ncbi:hypothetical protein CRM22_003141 [Opisthorchis felineus]|uniref:Uncharacterized protein n=1 Tax=Opisthorchis felineus TaxID=147828 RepID=A0A4S2M8X7_OPIFE|nr:hypothetical protein CRM22_003141 [Opisthorchis felineus]
MDQLRNSSSLDLQTISPMFLQASVCLNYQLDYHYRLIDDSETSSIGIWLEMDQNLNALEDGHEDKPNELEGVDIERIESAQSSRISPTDIELTSPENNPTPLETPVAPLKREARPSTHSGTVKYTTNLRAVSPDGNIVESEIIRSYEIPADILAEGSDLPVVDETDEHGIWLDGLKGRQDNESLPSIGLTTHLKISRTAEGSGIGSDISEKENRPASSTIPLGASAVTPFESPDATSNSKQDPSGMVGHLAKANQKDHMKQRQEDIWSQKEQENPPKEEVGQELEGEQMQDGLYALEQNLGEASKKTVNREHEANKENLEDQSTGGKKDDERQQFESPYSQDYQIQPNALDEHGNLPPRDKLWRVKGVDDSVQGTCTSSKITDASRSYITKLHVLLKDTCKDLEEIQSGISQRDFRPCKSFIEHVDMIPNTLNELIPTLEYSPYEEDLWKAQEGIVRVLEETKQNPALIILHLLELGFYIFEVGTLLCEDLLPSCFAPLVHAILSRVHLCTSGDQETATEGYAGVGIALGYWMEGSLTDWISNDSRLYVFRLTTSLK